MSFAYPAYLFLVLVIVPLVWLQRKRQTAVGYSDVAGQRGLRSVPLIGWVPVGLFALASTCLCLALAGPLLSQVKEKKVIETRDFIIATDISGSMWSAISDPGQQQFANSNQGSSPAGGSAVTQQPSRRIDVAQQAIKLFVARRKGDRVALFVFDTDTYYCWPLTDDLKVILRKSQLLNLTEGGGTNFDGPSDSSDGIGPLQAALDHFRDFGRAKTKVFVIVTDGDDSMSHTRFEELARQFADQHIRVYVLGVGENWSGNMPDIQRFAERLGGTVILVGNAQQMRDGFAKIDRMEKSRVELEKSTSHKEIYHWFVALSVVLYLLYFASTALVRESN